MASLTIRLQIGHYVLQIFTVFAILIYLYRIVRGKFLRTINFAVFENFPTASIINSSKSYYSIESYDSLVDPRNLIREMYCGEITSKFSSSKITRYTA